MFDMGFFPDLKRIIACLPAKRQTLLFSATMPPEVARLGQAILRNPLTVAIGMQGTPVAERHADRLSGPGPPQDGTAATSAGTNGNAVGSGVHANAARGAAPGESSLRCGPRRRGIAQRPQPGAAARAMQGFRTRAFPVLVATNIAARGLDVRHITHVVNFDVPDVPEEYIHRIGRTGRAGDKGDALVLVSPEESGPAGPHRASTRQANSSVELAGLRLWRSGAIQRG